MARFDALWLSIDDTAMMTRRFQQLHFHWPVDCRGGGDESLGGLSRPELRRLLRRVGAVSTTRLGGVSKPPFDGFNLGFHVGDDPQAVRENRCRFSEFTGSEVQFCWLSQVHGTRVVCAEEVVADDEPPEADAAVSRTPSLGCVVLTADCLPVLFCDREATVVAAAHAGWRGLAAGVLEATVEAMEVDADELLAWLGPAIGADVFEVGEDVLRAFCRADPKAEAYFEPSPFNPDSRWVADLAGLARERLHRLGVEMVFGGRWCTYRDEQRFFSYRRDGTTGRMATAIWLRGDDESDGVPMPQNYDR